MKKNKGLGRGLRALIPTEPDGTEEAVEMAELPLDRIKAGVFQARRQFDEDALQELAASIKAHGVMQPAVVRPMDDGFYELIVGERRWRASQLAGLESMPCVIRAVDDQLSSEMMLVENIQREDLNPIEEAQAYARLKDEFGLTQEEMAQRVGKSRPAVANSLRLLQLPVKVQGLLAEDKLSVGHGKVLLGLAEDEEQLALALQIIKQGLTVREAEKLALKLLKEVKEEQQEIKERDYELEAVEEQLREFLGTKVKIKKGRRGGRIEIGFYSNDELDRLLELLLLMEN